MRRARRAFAAIALSGALSACTAAGPFAGGRVDAARSIADSPWRWTDDEGISSTFARWRGSTIVTTGFFGSCTLRCPMTIDKLREMDDILRSHGRFAEFVLVTIDPDNDTVDRLRRLKESRHLPSRWHLLRGSREDTKGFASLLRLNVARDSGHIDHEVKVAVFDVAGNFVRTFSGWNFGEDDILAATH